MSEEWTVTHKRHSDHYWVQCPNPEWPDGIMYLCEARYKKSADYIANGLNRVECLEAENKHQQEALKLADEMATCARTTREIIASMVRKIVELGYDVHEILDHLDVGNVDGFGVKIDNAIQAYDKFRGKKINNES